MRRWLFVAALIVTSACSGGERTEPRPGPTDGVVVTSFDFAESQLIAEIYAQALEDEGIAVDRQIGLGPRELVLTALRQGFVDIVPEYAGSALDAAAPGSDVDRNDVTAVVDALADAVRDWGLDVLAVSLASNQNVLAVTRDTALGHAVTSISDLRPIASSLTIGGPPECPDRPRCLVGLAEVYGLGFGSFVPLADEELVRRALLDGVIDVGVLFSTDASLAGDALVVLVDDRGLQPVDNIVPVIRRGAIDAGAVAALDEVSARLTTTNLRFLNWRVANGGNGIAAEARGWLVRHGLVAR